MRDTVELKGGLIVTEAALRLLWDLEDRGFMIALGKHGLRIAPRERLSGEDRACLRAHRLEVARLVRYVYERGWEEDGAV